MFVLTTLCVLAPLAPGPPLDAVELFITLSLCLFSARISSSSAIMSFAKLSRRIGNSDGAFDLFSASSYSASRTFCRPSSCFSSLSCDLYTSSRVSEDDEDEDCCFGSSGLEKTSCICFAASPTRCEVAFEEVSVDTCSS